MTISKTSYGKWRVRVDVGFDENGTRIRKSANFNTKREAQAQEVEWLELKRKKYLVASNYSLEQFTYDVYLPEVKARIRYKTYKRYLLDIETRIVPMLGRMQLDDISHVDVQRLIDSCKSNKMARTAHATLRQILNCAINHSFVTRNIAQQQYTFPAKTVHPQDHYGDWLTTFDEHEQFLKQIDNKLFYMIVRLGLGLGLRTGEIFGLNWEDVDFNTRLVHVQRTYVKEEEGFKLMPPKTYESNRFIPMHKNLYNYLVNIYNERGCPSNGAIVINYLGNRASPSKCAAHWREYILKHDLKNLTFLNLRHSFATACLNAGFDITKVSKLLGHTSIETTMKRYVRFKASDLIDEFDKRIS